MQTVSGMTIRGELTAKEDLTFDGTFEGSIDLAGHHFVAARNARVNAAINARAVTVDGTVEGHITADVVDIGPTATVEASVIAPRVALEDGAVFNGPVNTERARAAGTVARHRQKPA
jgi:cytoskeletal protein CcmA (bactofilin family)